jgi:ABC-2 type transport system permease protein
MGKYWLVFKLSVQDIFQYRLDFLIHSAKYASMVLLMTIVWLAVQEESGKQLMTRTDTISYFAFAAILYSLSSFHTWYIEEDIKLGGLTKYLVKPIQPFLYYFTHEGANAVCETLLKAIIMIPILGLMGLLPLVDGLRLFIFMLFLPLAFIYSFHQFFVISICAFCLQEIHAVRWSLMIVFRFLAGILVPLTFFPQVVQRIIIWLPFPHLAFTPIQLLRGNIPINQGINGLLILMAWTILMRCVGVYFWNKGTHSYESTGI